MNKVSNYLLILQILRDIRQGLLQQGRRGKLFYLKEHLKLNKYLIFNQRVEKSMNESKIKLEKDVKHHHAQVRKKVNKGERRCTKKVKNRV